MEENIVIGYTIVKAGKYYWYPEDREESAEEFTIKTCLGHDNNIS